MERWATVKQIHQAAVDRPMSERTAFLDEICAGDEALRSDIQSLLSYQHDADSFIEVPAIEVAARVLSDNLENILVGRVLGHYHIAAFLGAGGMGEVYLARDPRLGRTGRAKTFAPGSAFR